jgi:hypothetical protein
MRLHDTQIKRQAIDSHARQKRCFLLGQKSRRIPTSPIQLFDYNCSLHFVSILIVSSQAHSANSSGASIQGMGCNGEDGGFHENDGAESPKQLQSLTANTITHI